MIVSHKYRFVFVKTEKTASTSVEIGLSEFLGEDDIITPIAKGDEEVRKQLGFRGPQNYQVSFARYRPRDWARLLLKGARLVYQNHSSASFAKRMLGAKAWGDYFKFCVERNPWDKTVSWYFNQSEPRPSLTEFIAGGRAAQVRGWSLYTIDGLVAVDRICRFESLEDEMIEIARQLGFPRAPILPRAKSDRRTDRRPYQEILRQEEAEHVARLFRSEIRQLGYEWSPSA